MNRLWNLVFPRIRKGSSLFGFDWKGNPEKGLRQRKKISQSWNRNLRVCVCVREKKISFKIHLITLIDIRNVNLLFKKDFKFAELLTKPSFFAYFRDIPENGEWNKVDVERICAKVTKHVSKKVAKADANLNWLWTIKFIMDCFDCIFIFTNDLA